MGKQKFNVCLASKVREEQEFEKNQERLKKQYGIEQGKKVVVVEKSNTFKFTVKTVSAMIRTLATILILAMAVIGLLALIYPETRAILWEIEKQLITELQQYLHM